MVTEERARIIDTLLAFARHLEEHEDIPVPLVTTDAFCLVTVDEMERIKKILGVETVLDQDGDVRATVPIIDLKIHYFIPKTKEEPTHDDGNETIPF